MDSYSYAFDHGTGLEISAGSTKQEKEMNLAKANRDLASAKEAVKKSVTIPIIQ